jgi:hypothetical protein
MNLTRGARRAVIAIVCAAVAAIYAFAWLTPAIGLYHDDAVYLETAKSLAAGHGYIIESLPAAIPQTKYPPLWPAVLALFVLVSQNTLWLKLAPLLCTAGWLAVAYRLLKKMGATRIGAFALVMITAASPLTVFLTAHLLSEPLFALLLTASLLALLHDRPLAAGAFAGLTILTRTAGAPLAVAAVLVLVAYQRFRSAALFTGATLVFAAPWTGWSLAQGSAHPYYGSASYSATSILTSLHASEKLHVFASNIIYLFEAPFSLLTGTETIYAALITLGLLIWALVRRRQLIPDLFVALYCAMLLTWAGPPQRFLVPVFPLVLWLIWRGFQNIKRQELLAACLLIALGAPLVVDFMRIPDARRYGEFPGSALAPNDWSRMQLLFAWLRNNTPPEAVVMANLDPVFYLNTGRKAVRGFVPDGYKLYYSSSQPVTTPDQLASEIIHNGVAYVALTPDRDFAEAPAFHKAVEALERGGMLEPVDVPGAGPDYRLLRTATFRVNH